MPSPSSVFIPAYAKINWTLDVLGRRDDGYHELKSVMQTIALGDTLCLRAAEPEAIEFTCDVPALRSRDNLAVHAAHALRRLARPGTPGVRIELFKRTPAQAGLGGGSSDAAAVLVALNVLWGLRLDRADLERIGAEIGSDVPFFIRGGTALIEGRGERVTPLPDAEPHWLVIAKPPIGLPTAAVFGALTPDDFGRGGWSDAVVAATRSGVPLPDEALRNDLEPGVLRSCPEVLRAREILLAAGAPAARMSGSGTALFAPFRDLDAASDVYQSVIATGLPAWLTHTIAATAAHATLDGAWAAV